MTPLQTFLVFATFALGLRALEPTIRALRAPENGLPRALVLALTVCAILWSAHGIEPFPADVYRPAAIAVAIVAAYFIAQRYMNNVYAKELALAVPRLPASRKLIELLKAAGVIVGFIFVAVAASYLPAEVYLLISGTIGGTTTTLVDVLYWVFGVHLVWLAELGVIAVLFTLLYGRRHRKQTVIAVEMERHSPA